MIKKAFKSFVYFLLAIIICSAAFYFFRPLEESYQPFFAELETAVKREIAKFSPACQTPIYYSLGQIDKHFKLSAGQIRQAVDQAAGIWSAPEGKPLFSYATSGDLKLNFIYDYRQSATDKMNQLGIVVDNDQQSYDRVRAKYGAVQSQYEAQQAALNQLIGAFKSEQAGYDAQVAKWNQSGGAPAAVYAQLQQTGADLAAQQQQISRQAAAVNASVDDLNALATTLNSLANTLNLNVKKYNNIGSQAGEQFQEGLYRESATSTEIDIYEYKSQQQLVRLLAHELGHALGFSHTSGTSDIMYYLNDSKNDKLTAADLAQLKAKCGGNENPGLA